MSNRTTESRAVSVYVIGNETGFQKIGMGISPKKRLAGCQTGNPKKLLLQHEVSLDTNSARRVEAYAHYLLSANHSHGEWFFVSLDEAVLAVEKAVSAVKSGAALPKGAKRFRGRKPPGERPFTQAERQARARERKAEREAERIAALTRIRDEAATIRDARQIAADALTDQS